MTRPGRGERRVPAGLWGAQGGPCDSGVCPLTEGVSARSGPLLLLSGSPPGAGTSQAPSYTPESPARVPPVSVLVWVGGIVPSPVW